MNNYSERKTHVEIARTMDTLEIPTFIRRGINPEVQKEPLEQLGFFNTTRERGQRLKGSRKKANKQEILIMGFFRNNPELAFAPHYIHKKLFDENTPLTSTRRALSNLTKSKLLTKTYQQVMGPFGKMVYCWALNG